MFPPEVSSYHPLNVYVDVKLDVDDIEAPVETTIEETTETSTYPDDLDAVIRKMYKECKDAELKASVKNVIAEYGKLNDVDEDGLKRIYDMMN